MKKLQLLSLLMIIFALTSCSNDDNEPINLADNAIGSYEGYTNASAAYFSGMVSDNQTVVVTSDELNKVNISFHSDTWGDITINDAVLAGTDNNMQITGSGKSVMSHAGNAPKEYDCTVEGSLVGKNLSLIFTCPTVMGGLKIEFKQGEIPADIVVPGKYKGYTEASSTYFSGMMADNQEIVITQNDDNATYKVVYTTDTWGEFLIENATATLKDGKFVVTGKGTTKMGMNGNIKEYDCSIEGSIDSEKETPTFTFSVPSVMGGLSIVFHSGDMPTENE
ncbi:MAG: calycin-like domain-containing protein [Prevotella sp.]|nr:calycin-like domain-containing protein [Bacteroides sp.]MCM1366842.1 calycin-like domain-containing protein [Prevotella sp.]MCM1437192.1 calycin-like domain-containing protein [Prevotella sp.]